MQKEGTAMIVKEYCESMEKKLTVWRSNVEKLLLVAEQMSGSDPEADVRRRQSLESLITDIGKVAERLKYECLPA
jgi:hypothetical protein